MQIFLLAILAFLFVIVIRSAGQGKIGNLIAKAITILYQVDLKTAENIYFMNVRQYIDYIQIGTMLIFFLVLIRLLLSSFTRYFDEIIQGVNALADGKPKQIVMSPELGFVSEQLGKVNDELLRSAEAERKAEKRKNDLVAYLAHDIKTPLTSVIGYLSLLDESPNLPAYERSKYTQIALEKAYRLELLIGELFEITRYNMDTIPLQKEMIDLSYMISQMVDESYPQLTAKGKTVSVNIPADLYIYADSEKLARAFNNILKNAISYSDANSKIEIFGEKRQQDIVICFENAGNIPEDKADIIFEKFCRLDDARQSATGGAGLGLAIAKDIVTLHGGAISAGNNENHTVFTVILPDGISV